ncbi:methylated-DNA--[protein]-cysteine S-methyltransferase [Listeria welshimeri]|nr:methylated-DNA--[protein]-cysteine S-methyltransferase [Listeria welshimeri]
MEIYYDSIRFLNKEIYFMASEKGLTYIGVDKKQIQHATLDPKQMMKYKEEIVAYLNGELNEFSLATDVNGTALQLEVFAVLKTIPYGETRTYTEIAAQIKRPKAVRAVGAAIGKNPVLIVIPCHRVIGKNGKLTGYRDGLELKEALLALEKTV